ncbi:MAG: sulfatase [Lentisphaeraceae bacterium]|nr:sulfatase [Lentisphaeraceae bacterium]
MRFIALFICVLFSTTLMSADKPHILYINADDLGVMDVGYNNSLFRTPNIDRLAKSGMIFTEAYAPSANCAPSRACVHTGQWSARHGVYTVGSSERGKPHQRKLIPIKNTQYLNEKVWTMAEAMKDAGYKTIHLGKYHLGSDPLTQGFDENIGGDKAGSPNGGGYFSPWTQKVMKEWSDKYPKNTHRMVVYADQAVRFIKENKNSPMFIHFSPYSVHTPIQKVDKYLPNYKGKDVNANYASMVENFDTEVGRVLDSLKAEGIVDNTLIVLSSDNGGIRSISPQTPYRAGKGSYYEGGVREPFIVSWPAKVKAGTTNDTLVCTIDLFPTFLDVAKMKKPESKILDGVSLLPIISETGTLKKRALFWHFPVYLQAYNSKKDQARDPLFRTRPGSAMRYGKWKLHEYFEDGKFELYDLSKDIGETNNLVNSMPEKVSELKKMLVDWRQSINAPIPTKLNPEFKTK